MPKHTLALLLLAIPAAAGAQPALTIYNQDFAVVRESLPLELKQGVNTVHFAGATAQLEPESVILRDPAGQYVLQVLEQNYRADPISVDRLLSLFEGKSIDFLVPRGDRTEVVNGRIIRSGYVPRPTMPQPYYGPPPQPPAGLSQPIVEVDGKLRFQLPGTPLFPALAGDTILKPTLDWVLRSDRTGKLSAELCYVTAGMNWNADYNLVAPETGDALDLVGWVTMDNRSGKTFESARIKLMAGDVQKLQPRWADRASFGAVGGMLASPAMPPAVTQKSFDEYHLYTLQRPATLRDRETKQVEFVRAAQVKSNLVYVYDGARIDSRYQGWNADMIRNDPSYGSQSNPKVWVMRELVNSDANHLGMPLPAGRTRFYRRDSDGRLEFTGEDNIRHTPRDETIRVFTGAAFDLVGERKRVSYRLDQMRTTAEESFEIKVRNHKKTSAEVRVVEHLYRWFTWQIDSSSQPYRKTDAQTMEFTVPLQPGEEKTVTYMVRYTW